VRNPADKPINKQKLASVAEVQ